MRFEKRLAINEMKEVLKNRLVTKICGGRVWVVRAVEWEVENDTEASKCDKNLFGGIESEKKLYLRRRARRSI